MFAGGQRHQEKQTVVLHKHVGLQLAVTAHKQTTGRDNPEGDSEEDLPDMRHWAVVV